MAKKIYLLSGGDRLKGFLNEELRSLLEKDLKGKENLVAIGAKRKYEDDDIYFYGNEENLGVVKTFSFSDLKNFSLINGRIDKKTGLELLKKADIIYLQGGDPFVQIKYVKDNGYEEFLRNYQGIILGLSAGAMNLGKTAFYSKDEDYPETIFYEGLGLIDITVDPHFDVNNKQRVEEAVEGSKKHEIIGLPDYSAIIIDNNGKVKYIGKNYIFNNGKHLE